MIDCEMAILGASERIDVLAPRWSSAWVHPIDVLQRLMIVDRRIPVRAVVGNSSNASFLQAIDAQLAEVRYDSWSVKRISRQEPYSLIIVDDEYAFIFSGSQEDGSECHGSNKEELVESAKAIFERIWHDPERDSKEFSFSSAFHGGVSIDELSRIDRMIRDAALDPSILHRITSRSFEELVAELLSRDGLDIELTPETRDGGRDILATSRGPFGSNLFLVECKKFAPNRPVDVSVVRALYGVVEAERANGGLLVTTSYLSQPSISFAKSLGYRMQHCEGDRLSSWIQRINDKANKP